MNDIDSILKNYEQGILTYVDANGFHNININEFLKLGSEDVLKNLNRTYEVLLKVANADKTKFKWVNDYAMAYVVTTLFEKVMDMSAEIIEKDSEIERLKNESVASKVGFETIDGISQEEADKLNNKINELTTKLAEKETQYTNVITENAELKNKLSSQEATHDELKKVVTENRGLSISLEEFKAALTSKQKDYEALKNNYNEIENSYLSLQSANTELEERSKSLETEIADRKRAFSEMLEKYKTMDDSNNTLKQKNEELENLASELQRQLDEAYVDYDKLKYTLETSEKENSNFKKTIENYQLSSQANNEQLNKYKEAVNNLISSLGLTVNVKNGVVEQSQFMHRMGDHLENKFNAL